MKRYSLHLFSVLIVFLFSITILPQPSVTQVILPQYIQGLNGTNNNRVPFAFRAKLDGLTANATYRFINQVVISTDASTTNGAGNCIFIISDNSFVRTSGPSFSSAGNYGEFNTDNAGSYTGWFITEPTGNARFVPGNYVFMRIRLNDGAGGTSAVTYLTLPDSVRVLDFGTSSSASLGTAIFGSSLAESKDFVLLYDNIDGTGRPISSTLIENDSVDVSVITSYALFYRDSVDGKTGRWGTIIPNILTNGIQRIERRMLDDGSIHSSFATDTDGIWPSGANTVNPIGGLTTPIRLDSLDAPVPIELISFSATFDGNAVKLTWKTASELNNRGFEVERKRSIENWTKIGFVSGNGTGTSIQEYSFVDNNIVTEKYLYRLKQIDNDGSFNYSSLVEIDLALPSSFILGQNYPNPFNPATTIKWQSPINTHQVLKVFDLLGNEVAVLVDEFKPAGKYEVNFDASNLFL